MRIGERLDRILSRLEWRWSLAQFVWGGYVIISTALPAWAVSATDIFQHHAPLSWVVSGFAGLSFALLTYAIYAWANAKLIRSRYNRELYEKTGFVDPMANTFEDRRIFLAEFCLPSDPYLSGKTFVNCEIIGPSVLFLRWSNRVDEHQLPNCDAIVLRGRSYHNAITVDRCTFRGCSFKRITVMVLPEEFDKSKELDWLNWLAEPQEQPFLPGMLSPTEDAQNTVIEGVVQEAQS